MRILHYNCFAGICGDMNLAALVDLGVSVDALIAELNKLKLDGWEIQSCKDVRNGITGTRVDVIYEEVKHHDSHHHSHRHFSQIRKIIEESSLSDSVKQCALEIFTCIAKAEAQVHNTTVDKVHFHEVGAIDSIIDIVGAAICLDLLGVDKVTSSSVELGGGTIECAHGRLPVPAPATALMTQGMPVSIGAIQKECTTPTGAAILAATCEAFNPQLTGNVVKTGFGIGQRQNKDLANVLQVSLYEADSAEDVPCEQLVELAANIDDMTAEDLSYLQEKIFDAGALDVWFSPATMKKSRPGVVVQALTQKTELPEVREAFFQHSSTLGVRENELSRYSLKREIVELDTCYGIICIKRVYKAGAIHSQKPEYDDCRLAAEKYNVSIKTVKEAVLRQLKEGS